jgi:predicted GIY-YIG superfamily endonuclease
MGKCTHGNPKPKPRRRSKSVRALERHPYRQRPRPIQPTAADAPVPSDKPYHCYLLRSEPSNLTYVGITNDIVTRLRRHNGQGLRKNSTNIKGGAKYTKRGRPWKFVCWVSGFQTKRQALQFEWKWKKIKATHAMGWTGGNGVRASTERRFRKLLTLFRSQRWTCNSPEACSVPLTIHIEDKSCAQRLKGVLSSVPSHIRFE